MIANITVKGCGLMDKASGYEPEDCGFKSHQLCFFINKKNNRIESNNSIDFSNQILNFKRNESDY